MLQRAQGVQDQGFDGVTKGRQQHNDNAGNDPDGDVQPTLVDDFRGLQIDSRDDVPFKLREIGKSE